MNLVLAQKRRHEALFIGTIARRRHARRLWLHRNAGPFRWQLWAKIHQRSGCG